MARCRTTRITYALVAAATALGTTVAAAGSSFAATSATSASAKLVTNPASLVNPFIGTSGGVDTFPGPDTPFGMIQWSPDTTSRPDGGGYEYNDSQLIGYSLTHLSGPGCSAYGDVPILPTVGAIGTSPRPNIQSMTVNGKAWNKAYLDYASLSSAATLDYTLSSTPNTSWASSTSAAPPSDPTGEQTAVTSADPARELVVAPGSTGTATLTVGNLTSKAITAYWTADDVPPAPSSRRTIIRLQ